MLDALLTFRPGGRWPRRGSQASGDSMFGDEELEEGYGIGDIQAQTARRTAEAGEDRRLSRDLETGFRDDSDEDESDTHHSQGQYDRTRV